MKTCEYAGSEFTEPRSHPWIETAADPNCRYYDLTESPALIRTALEDFRPWSRYPAVEEFYALLERLNHRRSTLESNDCSFSGPAAHDNTSIAKGLECSGRVMILFRQLELNTVPARVEWLKDQLHAALGPLDPRFDWGMVGTCLVPVRYLALPVAGDQQLGTQLMISFWAWGNSEAETMSNLGRLVRNLLKALRSVARVIDRPE